MNDIDRYVDQACRSVAGPAALRRHLRRELEEHLEEAIEALVAEGMSRDDATVKAIEGFGDPEKVREGLQSVYGHSLTSLFVDRAMKWKEATMKSEWKWSFAAQTGLVLIIAVATGVFAFTMIFIVPKVGAVYSDRGEELPAFLQPTIDVSGWLFNYWYVCAIALVGALGLFEWKCSSENKALIRTAAGVAASLVATIFSFWVVVVTMISTSLVLA